MNTYFLYARKSSESEDRQMLSIDSQLNELKIISKKNNLKIIDTLTESKSAKSPGRPLFNSMAERIKKGEANSILVWNPDRLSRNSVDAGMLIYLLDIGVLKEIITPSNTYGNNPNDKFMLSILWGQAKLENDNKGISVKRGMKTKAEMGWYPYPAMNGYLNTPERPKGFKILIKDPERFHMVRKMWDLMLTGIYTLPQVLKIVNEDWGYRNRNGKPISRSAMYIMFSHPFYYGYFFYTGVWYKGKHEPMVSKEEWDKVQKLIHRYNVSKPVKNDFLYIDLLKCGHCNFSVTATRKEKHYKRTDRDAVYTYYHCSHKNKAIPCDEKAVTEKDIEIKFADMLGTVEIDDDFKEWALQYYHELSEYESKNAIDINTTIQKSISDITVRLDTLLDLMLSQSLTKEQYDKKRQDLLVEKSSLEKKLTESSSWLSKSTKVINTAHDIRNKFKSKLKDDKRILLRTVGSNLFLEKGLVRPILEKPYFILADAKVNPQKYLSKLEPVNYPFLSPQTLSLAMMNPVWLPRQDLNLEPCRYT